jgi:hypothetical protein
MYNIQMYTSQKENTKRSHNVLRTFPERYANVGVCWVVLTSAPGLTYRDTGSDLETYVYRGLKQGEHY